VVLGQHALPVRSDEAAPETRNALPFSLTIWVTASATPEFGVSTITSTLSVSSHWRAMPDPTSGLFWGSAETISAFIPFLAAPKSSPPLPAATTEPWPGRTAERVRHAVRAPVLL